MTAQRRTKRPRTPAQLANDQRLGAARHEATKPLLGEGKIETFDPATVERVDFTPESTVERPAMRPEMRASGERQMSSSERAAARAAQIFGNVDLDSEEDKFALPSGLAPEDWEYEWKTHEVIGKRNPGYEVELSRKGWDPVDTSRHPEMMPVGYQGPITREGMVLMERPKVVNDRQKKAAYAKAVGQLRGQEQLVGVAPPNTMQRQDSTGRATTKISHEYVSPGALQGEGFVPVSHRGGPVPVPE